MGVEPDLMQDGRLQVANADWVLGNIVTDVIGYSVAPGLNAAACHPHCEGMGMMIAPVAAFLQSGIDVVLHHRRAAEFTAPDDQGFIEEPALLQVGDQTGNGSVDLLAFNGQGFVNGLAG